jgi:hypothetical protein
VRGGGSLLVNGVTVREAVVAHRPRVVPPQLALKRRCDPVMVKSTLRPWTPPLTGPVRLSTPSVPVATAIPLASGPVELKRTTAPLAYWSVKTPSKPYWLQGGSRGRIGCACAGGETVRNPTALIAVAAASNWDLFTMIACDIGNPFHLTHQSARNDLFGRWRENRTGGPPTLRTDHQGGLE